MKRHPTHGLDLFGASSTRVTLLRFLMTHDGYFSRAELAEACFLEQAAIRSHLEILEDIGAITPNLPRGMRNGVLITWTGNRERSQQLAAELVNSIISS